MPYSKKSLDTALERLERRRMENRLTAEHRHTEVCKAIPEYSALELSLAGTMTRSITAIAERRPDSGDIIVRALKENAAIQQKMARLLAENKFPENYTAPIYTCEKCSDSGIVEGHWCDCFTELLNIAASEELNASSPLKLSTFESFDLLLYSDKFDGSVGGTQRAIMEQNLQDCIKFADDFNENFKKRNCRGLLLLGNTGLGKTHLSLAVAREVIKSGHSVVYNSAPELMRKLNREFYGRSDTDTMQLITTCDLLILDDLGSETKSEQNTSMLYEIVNARNNRQIPMIVNSNLTVDEINERYQDRIFSRLLSLRTLIFCGNDNRLKIIDN